MNLEGVIAGKSFYSGTIEIEKALTWCQEKIGYPLAEGQRKAVELSLKERVTIITGGPGVGKTTILRSLVSILKAKKTKIMLAAPTGRAARRMSETTSHFAQTVHRLLVPGRGQWHRRRLSTPQDPQQ